MRGEPDRGIAFGQAPGAYRVGAARVSSKSVRFASAYSKVIEGLDTSGLLRPPGSCEVDHARTCNLAISFVPGALAGGKTSGENGQAVRIVQSDSRYPGVR